jgi:peptidyl-prolyl cis-trans isomerase C
MIKTSRKSRMLFAGMMLAAALIVFPAVIHAVDTELTEKDSVARVNGRYISLIAYQRQFRIAKQQMQQQGMYLDEAGMNRLAGDVLRSLIDNELLFQEGKMRGHSAEKEKVAEQYDAIQNRFPGEQEFRTALEEMHYTESSFREAIERRFIIEELIDGDIAASITVSDDEARRYYENNQDQFAQPKQVRARHILISVEEGGTEEQKQDALRKIKDLQRKLKDGEDFAALASTHSEGPSSAQGGDLGFFQRGQMVKPFEDAAFSMEVGEISDVVETRFGFHLILVTDIQDETTVPYEYAKSSIEQYLMQNRVMSEVESLVNRLKDEATIERYQENMQE